MRLFQRGGFSVALFEIPVAVNEPLMMPHDGFQANLSDDAS